MARKAAAATAEEKDPGTDDGGRATPADSEAQATTGKPFVWEEFRDAIEAEIVRHERAFEDVIGEACRVSPPRTPLQLHALRRAALIVSDDRNMPARMMEAALDELKSITFEYPQGAQSSS